MREEKIYAKRGNLLSEFTLLRPIAIRNLRKVRVQDVPAVNLHPISDPIIGLTWLVRSLQVFTHTIVSCKIEFFCYSKYLEQANIKTRVTTRPKTITNMQVLDNLQ